MKKNSVVRVGSTLNQQSCLVGAHCSHAVLTAKIGVYRCPFGACFKKLENQKRGASQMVDVDRAVDSSVQEGKVLSCMFYDDVLCSYRKSEKFGVMDRCRKCRHYKRFLREMAEEDEKVMAEIDRMYAERKRRFESHG
jgi:hypothetical protein